MRHAKERRFAFVNGDGNDYAVEKARSSRDHIQVTVGDWIETPRINRSAHRPEVNTRRQTVEGNTKRPPTRILPGSLVMRGDAKRAFCFPFQAAAGATCGRV